MTGKRWCRLPLGTAIALFGTMQLTSAAPCMWTTEKHGFEVRAMQSQLMIVALHCNDDGGYNAYVRQHQADVSGAYQQIGKYFARSNGTSGDEERDAFITQLANAQEVVGLKRSNYCVSMHPFVAAALAVQNDQEMENLLILSGINVARLQICPDQLAHPGPQTLTKPTTPRVAPDATQTSLRDLLNRIETGH